MNNQEREMWVNNDEGLYNWWRGSRKSMRDFITENRVELDAAIDRALHPRDQNRRTDWDIPVEDRHPHIPIPEHKYAGRRLQGTLGLITYAGTREGNYLVTDLYTNKDILFQVDYEYPDLAHTFGWDGKILPAEDFEAVNIKPGDATAAEIYSAIQYLDDNEGKEVEDPGYFEPDQKELDRRAKAPKMRDEKGELPYNAWPGGYPIFYLTEDNGILCPKCANEEEQVYVDEDPKPGTPDAQWHIVASDAHYEGPPLICDNCNAEIESAYGDPEEEKALEKIVAIYDNGGKTADRYAIYVNDTDYLGLSDDCNMPNGFSQWGAGRLGEDVNGKKIRFEDLPEKVQKCVKARLMD